MNNEQGWAYQLEIEQRRYEEELFTIIFILQLIKFKEK